MIMKNFENLVKHYGIFFLYIITLSVIGIFLSYLLFDIRENGYINADVLNDAPSSIAELWYILLTFCFGLFYGAVLITLFDIKKKVQGIWISLSSIVFLYIFYYVIHIRPDIFIFGFIISAGICYKKGKSISGKYKEYPFATLLASLLVLLMVWLSFIDYILVGPSDMRKTIGYLLLTISFTWIFILFSRYELKNSRIFVIGPRQSGKTVFMCGCYDRADKLEKTIGPPSKDLEDAVRNLYKGWLPGTVIPKDYMFKYMHGQLFVNEVELNMYDIGGEFYELHINEIVSCVKKLAEEKKDIVIDGIDDDVMKIGNGIYNSDKLIFIIDGARIGDNEDYITNIHTEIIRSLPDKPYYIIVTKSDKFYNFNQGLTEEGYKALRQIVLDKLQQAGNLRFIIKGHYKDIIPVFFMESRGTPAKEEGDFITLGFDNALEAIS